MSLDILIKKGVEGRAQFVNGVLLTRPMLSSISGLAVTYTASVRITSPDVNFSIPTFGGDELSTLENINELRNVPIASDDRMLIYADVGQPVIVARLPGGRFEITGLAKSLPGHFRELIMVDLCSGHILSITDSTTSSSPLPYGYMGTSGGYGTAAYGLTGIYLGGTLKGVRA